MWHHMSARRSLTDRHWGHRVKGVPIVRDKWQAPPWEGEKGGGEDGGGLPRCLDASMPPMRGRSSHAPPGGLMAGHIQPGLTSLKNTA